MNRPLFVAISAFLLLVALSLSGKPVDAGHASFGCRGCNGCYRVAWWGGGCWGCGGQQACSGCSGCFACSGCSGCSGCHAYPVRRYYYSRCGGCQGCGGCHSSRVVYRWSSCDCSGWTSDCSGWSDCGGCHAAPAVEPQQTTPPATSPKAETPKQTSHIDGQHIRISVHVPADAKVFINGYLTKSTGEERVYDSPVADADATYGYEVKAEVVRDGKSLAQTQRTTLRAGEETELHMDFEQTQPAQAPVAQTVMARSK